MKFVAPKAKYYGGIDLHAKMMTIRILDRSGRTVTSQKISCSREELLDCLKPYRDDLVLGLESTFNWYWVADLCEKEGIALYLGHALYMKHIHGGKSKNDVIDAKKIAHLLRTGYFPVAYAYPQEMRATRDLLRRRHYLSRLRSGKYTHLKNMLYQEGNSTFAPSLPKRKRARATLAENFEYQTTGFIAQKDIELIELLDKQIDQIERVVIKEAQSHDPASLQLLKSVPGMGDILALTILYETHVVDRFRNVGAFCSYARVVKCEFTSNGKPVGVGNEFIGNSTLKWAFSLLVTCALNWSEPIKQYHTKLKDRHGAARSLARLRHQFAVAVFFMLKNKEPFDEQRFLSRCA
ncbi:MAG TPA: IS110 family transposase [Ruminiclostridium sp.]|nr:IS110 family transposase [Ruminiclostridium sp.]